MKRLLFIRFSSLGDTILTTGIIRRVSELLPNAEIHILTYEEFAAVWQPLPFVARIHTVRRDTGTAAFIAFLRGMPEFDRIFDLHASVRSSVAARLIKGYVSVCRKQSFCRRLFVKFRVCGRKLDIHTVQRYARAVFPVLGFSVPSLEELRPFIPNKKTTDAEKVVLHPFASRATKLWPYFSELARYLAAGRRVYVIGKGDFPAVEGVERVNTPELAGMFDFISDAALVVTTDSGPMHAAVALNRKVVAVAGSTTKELGFFPLFDGCGTAERTDVLCRPCHVHGLPACPRGHFNCMKLIDVESVIKIIEEIQPL